MPRPSVPPRALAFALIALVFAPRAGLAAAPSTVRFPAADGLEVTADLYAPAGDAKAAPFVLLLHQAGGSRGEYGKIAPRLAEAGFTCLALDQRAGGAWEGLENETARRAVAEKRPAERLDVLKDVEGALAWRKAKGYAGPLVVWGSSYSASLAFFVVNRLADDAAGIVAFSPGDYLPPQGATGREAAKIVRQRVLLVAPDAERKQAESLFRAIPGKGKRLLIQPAGVHGSSTLYRTDASAPWEAVTAFLAEVKRPPPRKAR